MGNILDQAIVAARLPMFGDTFALAASTELDYKLVAHGFVSVLIDCDGDDVPDASSTAGSSRSAQPSPRRSVAAVGGSRSAFHQRFH